MSDVEARSRSLSVLVLAHGRWLEHAPRHQPFRPIDLSALPVPHGITSQGWLSECVFFLSDIMLEPASEYIWLCSGRHDDKRVEINTRIADLPRFVPRHESEIWCVDVGDVDWPEQSERYHPGLGALIQEMRTVFALRSGPAPYANSWCMHRNLVPSFLDRWRVMFWYFHNKYGMRLPFDAGPDFQDDRKGAYFYERVTMAILADMGLTMRQVP